MQIYAVRVSGFLKTIVLNYKVGCGSVLQLPLLIQISFFESLGP